MRKVPTKEYFKSRGRLSILTVLVPMGNDLCVVIIGGEVPHIGAIAIAQARKSLKDPNRLSATTSVLTLLGHKEDEIVRSVAHKLAKLTGHNILVSCGIHVDNITESELEFVHEYIEELYKKIVGDFCQ